MTEHVSLKRSLTLPLVTCYGLGNILGAGIYVLVGKVAGQAGMFAPLSFFAACFLAALTAFTYAELSSRYPLSAGEAVYLQAGFRIAQLSTLVGVLIILAGIVSASTIARGFVGYFQVFVNLPGDLIIILLVTALGGLAAWGISESVRVAVLLTVIEVVGLIIIVAVAAPNLLELPARLPELIPSPDLNAGHSVFAGAFLAFYAFIGFEDMVNVAEEVRDAHRTLPRAILLSLGLATVLYFAVALACILTVAPEELSRSEAPLALIYERTTGSSPVLISLISLFAVINGALIQIIMAARVCYGLSKQGWLPAVLGRVNTRTRTPLIATFSVTALVLVMALWFPIETLASATSFLILVVFALVNLALLRIKRLTQETSNVFSVPNWIPVCGFLSCTFLVVFQLTVVLK